MRKMRSQVDPDQYYKLSYDSKERFCSYWHQINEVLLSKPEKVLEVGLGNGFVSEYLRKRGLKITTLDSDKRLNPDVVGSVLELPFADESFNVVTCCEVLEHLPYEDFNKALSAIFRVSKSYAVLSIPEASRVYRLNVQIPRVGEIKKLVSLPGLRKAVPNFDGEHYWEIGMVNYSLDKIINDIKKMGFKIERTYRVFEIPYHRFFVLRKKIRGDYGRNEK